MKDKSKKNNETAPIATCADMSKNLVNAGKFVKSPEAKTRLKAYFTASGVNPDDPKAIYGHTFGLNNLRSMLYNIETYNADPPAGAKLIKGIRTYYGMSVRDDKDFPLNPPDAVYPDLIFIPVLEDGNDFWDIIHLTDDSVILSGSRPCPNQCGFCFFQQ